jgi:hypothetical protein
MSETIRILEKENNRRGDLFGRLMADLFVALGYEQPRLNIHKAGRELDLSADHRLESRRAIAERKATAGALESRLRNRRMLNDVELARYGRFLLEGRNSHITVERLLRLLSR